MANIVFNAGKGKVLEYYDRVKSNDPPDSALVLVPIEAQGVESDSKLVAAISLAALLGGKTREQKLMGRKVLTAAELPPIPPPNATKNVQTRSLPDVLWENPIGFAIAKLVVCFRRAPSDADTAVIPLTMFDFPFIPGDRDIEMQAGVFYRAE